LKYASPGIQHVNSAAAGGRETKHSFSLVELTAATCKPIRHKISKISRIINLTRGCFIMSTQAAIIKKKPTVTVLCTDNKAEYLERKLFT
jgi:hypothetical protein